MKIARGGDLRPSERHDFPRAAGRAANVDALPRGGHTLVDCGRPDGQERIGRSGFDQRAESNWRRNWASRDAPQGRKPRRGNRIQQRQQGLQALVQRGAGGSAVRRLLRGGARRGLRLPGTQRRREDHQHRHPDGLSLSRTPAACGCWVTSPATSGQRNRSAFCRRISPSTSTSPDRNCWRCICALAGRQRSRRGADRRSARQGKVWRVTRSCTSPATRAAWYSAWASRRHCSGDPQSGVRRADFGPRSGRAARKCCNCSSH